MKRKSTTIENYMLIKKLGKGVSCSVFMGKHAKSGKLMAIKVARTDNKKIRQNLIDMARERKILEKLNHDRIIKLDQTFELKSRELIRSGKKDENVACCGMVLAKRGEIIDFLIHTGKFEIKLARYYFKQLVSALEYCHNQQVIHRDLKPENILLDENFNLLLADFGFAKDISKDPYKKLSTKIGTESYQAPELLSKMAYLGQEVDVFACGVILFIMVSGIPPFFCASYNDPYYRLISSGQSKKFWQVHFDKKPHFEKIFTKELRVLIISMLELRPSNRASIKDVICHGWMEKETYSQEELKTAMKIRLKQLKKKRKKEYF